MSPPPGNARSHRFARRVFAGAGIYGLVALLPMYLLEAGIGISLPAPLSHPEHFYGFVGIAVVWQMVFLLIASDVRRFRPLMLLGVLEKLAFGVPALALYAAGRIGGDVLTFGCIDLVLAALFLAAHRATGHPSAG
jgi:hypothetical protein